MCDYDLPLALIFEEILTDKPKEQAAQEQKSDKGERQEK
jgi:hypothetical protein